MVDRRCAIVTLEKRRVCMISSRATCTARSLALSSADVASSSSNTAGRLSTALAIATRCFWPPDSLLPFPPTCVA
eukprot:4161746-Prymnesium_polylepis.1